MISAVFSRVGKAEMECSRIGSIECKFEPYKDSDMMAIGKVLMKCLSHKSEIGTAIKTL